ncbi:conserved Plasmodium protein, unknown function [Plasmodium ovale wallikeri]|uniref:B box-type domain-containing protein n=1 Tax=Plasmodium ovale wallikeri TaxID=864142 RepID=A0A1A8YTS7_PLAOA|nr:conserved Plasmodium protein, unknown function [Plasmodium ovale wallikeri]
MNEKIVIRQPLFHAPNESKSNVLKYEKDNNFNSKRNDATNLTNHIYTSLPYKKNERHYSECGEQVSLDLNEKENMNCFVNKKSVNFNLKNGEKNIIQSYRKGEINANYNLIDNMYDVHYTNVSNKNLNDYIKHVNINHTAPCIGEFRTCMNCFLNISTLFCKTCNIFLCAICNIKLHKNNPRHVVNVCSSGLYENNYKYNDILLKEKDKWLVELDNNIPIKIREKCPIHVKEYIKYACKTCHFTLLCADCLLNDPVHVQKITQEEECRHSGSEKGERGNGSKNISKRETHPNEDKCNPAMDNYCEDRKNAPSQNVYANILPVKMAPKHDRLRSREAHSPLSKQPPQLSVPTQLIVSLHKLNDIDNDGCDDQFDNGRKNELARLKPGFKLIRDGHEIFTLVDAKNEIKEELSDKLDILCKKSLILKNTIPSLRNIYKYGKITCKNNKRSVRAGFTVTNNCLEKKKRKLHEHLKMLQDKSTTFLKKLDEERTNYRNYLEKKKNEIKHMITLSNRNAGLSLDLYVQKLESFKCLFFTKDNLIDIDKKLEIPHSQLKSKYLSSIIEKNKLEILNSNKSINDISKKIKNKFQSMFNLNVEIPIYPAHFRSFLQKRLFKREKVEPLTDKSKRRQRYFQVLPFTNFYMNIDISYQQQFMRKDTLHQKWEFKTVSIRSVYLCIHTHANETQAGVNISMCSSQLEEDREDVLKRGEKKKDMFRERENEEIIPTVKISGEHEKDKGEIDDSKNEEDENHFISKRDVNDLSNDIESIICISNVNIKPFSDPDITNITILEKRNWPYGIEITEYNDRNDLVGYWLLTKRNETEVNKLLDILISIKQNNKSKTAIPSFHPKINMNNSFFNFNENNINTIYKHFASGIAEHSFLHHFKNTSSVQVEGYKEGKTDIIETLEQCSSGSNNDNDHLVREESLLRYYDDEKHSEFDNNVRHLRIEDFTSNPLDVSNLSQWQTKEGGGSDWGDVHTCEGQLGVVEEGEEHHNKRNQRGDTQLDRFRLPSNRGKMELLVEERKSAAASESNSVLSNKYTSRSEYQLVEERSPHSEYRFKKTHIDMLSRGGQNKGATLHKLVDKFEKRNKCLPDVTINTVKKNVIDEGRHLLPLNIESNSLIEDFSSGWCSNGMYTVYGRSDQVGHNNTHALSSAGKNTPPEGGHCESGKTPSSLKKQKTSTGAEEITGDKHVNGNGEILRCPTSIELNVSNLEREMRVTKWGVNSSNEDEKENMKTTELFKLDEVNKFLQKLSSYRGDKLGETVLTTTSNCDESHLRSNLHRGDFKKKEKSECDGEEILNCNSVKEDDGNDPSGGKNGEDICKEVYGREVTCMSLLEVGSAEIVSPETDSAEMCTPIKCSNADYHINKRCSGEDTLCGIPPYSMHTANSGQKNVVWFSPQGSNSLNGDFLYERNAQVRVQIGENTPTGLYSSDILNVPVEKEEEKMGDMGDAINENNINYGSDSMDEAGKENRSENQNGENFEGEEFSGYATKEVAADVLSVNMGRHQKGEQIQDGTNKQMQNSVDIRNDINETNQVRFTKVSYDKNGGNNNLCGLHDEAARFNCGCTVGGSKNGGENDIDAIDEEDRKEWRNVEHVKMDLPNRNNPELKTPMKCLQGQLRSFHINGRAKMIKEIKKVQEQIEIKVKKYKIEMEEKRKIAPPKKKGNYTQNWKDNPLEGELMGDIPLSVVNHVLSQIGSKKLGS